MSDVPAITFATIGAERYLSRYRRVEDFAACCRACGEYGRTWACPPLAPGIEDALTLHRHALIICCEAQLTPGDDATAAFRRLREPLDRRLIALEGRTAGTALTFGGSCRRCPQGCTRPSGQPCRHPEEVRPSLEALGFDITATLTDLFGTSLSWDSHRLRLVGALFHSCDTSPQENF